MTDYTPYPTVTINGVTYQNQAISNISIDAGRRDIMEQPAASIANINLWTDATIPIYVNLSDPVSVAIQSATYGQGTRTNLVTNPSFEVNTTGWNSSNATLARITSDYVYGTACAEFTLTAGSYGQIYTASGSSAVTAGLPYRLSAYLKIPTGSTSATVVLRIYFYNSSSVNVGSFDTITSLTAGSDWTRVNVSGTAPATAVTASVTIFNNNAVNLVGNKIRVDGVLLEQSSTLNDYFDGSSISPIGCAWTGTANASTSTQTGTNYTIFTGTISDVDITLDAYGSSGSIARYSITAVGPLAQLNKRTAGAGGYSSENDGTRVFNILKEAFLTNWYDVSPTLAWSALPATTTWANYDGTSLALVNALSTSIDTPGQYALSAYTANESNALSLAQDAAQSGRGILYEGKDGAIYYDDYVARTSEVPWALIGGDLNAAGLRTAAQWSEISNDVSVSWRAGTEVARDEQSIILYGQLQGTRSTTLQNLADAQTQATAFLQSRSYPRMYPENLAMSLHNSKITNLTRDAMITFGLSDAVTTSALPAVFGTNFTGYIEGLNWQLTRYTADLTLTCSAQSETYPHKIWYQIPSTTTWTGYTPSTTIWSDL